MANSPITVRTAGLDDIRGIHEVHRSDPTEWRRLDGSTAPFEQLTVLERYLNGGPWMSPETCAAYVNDLILGGAPPLIALCNGRVVGEMEILFGRDRPFGKVVDLSILYVHRDERGRGVGRALVGEATRRGRALGCQAIVTTDPETSALPFYHAAGFAPALTLVSVAMPAAGAELALGDSYRELPAVVALSQLGDDRELIIGRWRSPVLLRQVLRQGAGPGRLAIPGAGGLVRAYSATVAGLACEIFIHATPFKSGGRARVHVFGPAGVAPSQRLVSAACHIAGAAGNSEASITVTPEEAAAIGLGEPVSQHVVYVRPL